MVARHADRDTKGLGPRGPAICRGDKGTLHQAGSLYIAAGDSSVHMSNLCSYRQQDTADSSMFVSYLGWRFMLWGGMLSEPIATLCLDLAVPLMLGQLDVDEAWLRICEASLEDSPSSTGKVCCHHNGQLNALRVAPGYDHYSQENNASQRMKLLQNTAEAFAV